MKRQTEPCDERVVVEMDGREPTPVYCHRNELHHRPHEGAHQGLGILVKW